ncbi:MAG: uracil phosphoribosyltransferase [Bacteroidetes bacterium]|nr:uracil phosphoribosyltransferase [Bacteroidota bacterium]
MIHILGNENSIFNEFISEIRDEQIQSDRMRFRRNMERMGEIFAYEISKKLNYAIEDVTTSLGVAKVPKIAEQPVVATILRAGLPLHLGILNYFDQADNAFISAYRKHHKDGTFDVQVEYLSSPDLDDRILILCDPMLATGTSMVLAYNALLKKGKPKHTHIVSVIASTEGVNYAKMHLPENVSLWMGAVDEELTAQSYIVPGLGDAGDLAFGVKS